MELEVKSYNDSDNKNEFSINNLNLEMVSSDKYLMNYGDIVLAMEGKDLFKPLRLEKDGFLQNKFGHFFHADFVGKPLGSKIKSYSKHKNEKESYITVVDLVPHIWDKAGERLTQIIFSPDISMILTMLDVQKDYIVMESGTGSGCLSFNIANALDTGHLYTYEFNKERAVKLQSNFKELGLDNKITVTNQDVLENGFNISRDRVRQTDLEKYENYCSKNNIIPDDENSTLNGVVDALFIDLPSPWAAVKFAKDKLKTNGVFVSFSPCMEQVEKTFTEMKNQGFIHPRMFEVCFRGYNFLKKEKMYIPSNFNPKTGVTFTSDLSKENNFYNEEVILSTSKNDMRGHTGYLTLATKGYN